MFYNGSVQKDWKNKFPVFMKSVNKKNTKRDSTEEL